MRTKSIIPSAAWVTMETTFPLDIQCWVATRVIWLILMEPFAILSPSWMMGSVSSSLPTSVASVPYYPVQTWISSVMARGELYSPLVMEVSFSYCSIVSTLKDDIIHSLLKNKHYLPLHSMMNWFFDIYTGDEGTDTNWLLSKIASFHFQTSEQRPSLLRHPNFEYRFGFVSGS